MLTHSFRAARLVTSSFCPHTLPRSCAALIMSTMLSSTSANIASARPINRLASITNTLQRTFTTTSEMANNNDAFKIENLFSVKGRVAVVTGAGTGIGLMATQALAVNGAKVYIVGRTLEKLETVVKTYGSNISGQIIPVQGDVSSKSDIARIYSEIKAKEDCVCILINNAGIDGATFETSAKSADEMSKNLFQNEEATFEDWLDIYRTNVPSCYFMTMAFLPLLEASTKMHKGWSGCVINTSSISGIVKDSQHHPAYNASKAATIHITKMMAAEIAKNNIKVRVNSIAPGVFPSEMTTDESDDKQKSQIPKEKYADKVPAQRAGKDEDMASGMLFVATNQYLNGQIVAIDGGYILETGSA